MSRHQILDTRYVYFFSMVIPRSLDRCKNELATAVTTTIAPNDNLLNGWVLPVPGTYQSVCTGDVHANISPDRLACLIPCAEVGFLCLEVVQGEIVHYQFRLVVHGTGFCLRTNLQIHGPHGKFLISCLFVFAFFCPCFIFCSNVQIMISFLHVAMFCPDTGVARLALFLGM